MADVYRQYGRPLQTYLQFKFHLAEREAEECVHDFLTHKLQRCCSKADSSIGKFRNFLMTAAAHYVLDRKKKANAARERPNRGISIDNPDVPELAAAATPAQAELDWTRVVIAEALREVKEFYEQRGKQRFWAAFEQRVVLPLLEDARPITIGQLIDQFGFESPQAVSQALADAKRKFRSRLQEGVARFAGNENNTQTEIRSIKRFLSPPSDPTQQEDHHEHHS
jgi:DNA-directed RNA polymerase specialized sigma24 family protein